MVLLGASISMRMRGSPFAPAPGLALSCTGSTFPSGETTGSADRAEYQMSAERACVNRPSSPVTRGRPSATSISKSRGRAAASKRARRTASATTTAIDISARTRVILPASILAVSRIVSMSARSSRPLCSMKPRLSRCAAESRFCFTMAEKPRIELSGLFRSWLTLAKRSDRSLRAASRASMARSWARAKTRKRAASVSMARFSAKTCA